MHDCAFAVTRTYVRVDHTIFRSLETRLFWDYIANNIIRDFRWRECEWNEIDWDKVDQKSLGAMGFKQADVINS